MSPTAFSEYFEDHEYNRHVIIPGLSEYFTTPSAENARSLLRSLGLPLPYAALNESLVASRRNVPRQALAPAPSRSEPDDLVVTLESSGSSSGGGRSRRSRAQSAILAQDALFDAHSLIDLLHDLLPTPPNDMLLARLYRRANIPPAVAAKINPLINTVRRSSSASSRVNHRLTEIAEELAGLSAPRPHIFTFNPDHTLSLAKEEMRLHAEVGRWYSKPTLEIVLDGVFRDVALPRADSIRSEATRNASVNKTPVARSLTLCAYLQLVMTDWDTVRIGPASEAQRSRRVRVTDIRFLVGDFQTLDVPGADGFIANWISHIQRETAYFSHLPPTAIGTRHITIADLPSLADTPFANVSPMPLGLQVKLASRPNATEAMLHAIREGTFVSYGREERKERKERKGRSGRKGRKGHPAPEVPSVAPLAERYRREFFTSNPKDWLRFVFREYGEESAPTPESEVFAETIAVVNAFRDAIRAEVALARGAVYITIDALALVYYQARADRTAGASKKSNGLMIHPAGQENLSIKYYSPSAAARASATRAAGI